MLNEELKDLVVYSYRIDAEHTEIIDNEIKNYVEKHDDCKYYIFAREFGETTQKPHYQGCLFLTKEVVGQTFRNIKSKKWVNQHKNNVAFAKAKKVESIVKYCNNKEKQGIITNMPQELLDTLGEWIPRDQFIQTLKKSRKDNDSTFKEILAEKIKTEWKISVPYQGYELLANIAYDVYEKPIPMRSLVLLSKGIIEKELFLKMLYRELHYVPN